MANMNVDAFTSNIRQGLASPNRYEVEFNNPIGGNNPTVSIMCNVANLPGRSIKTYENRHYGVPFKLPFSAEYADISFSFITRTDLIERKFFEFWQEKVIDPETGLIQFYDDFKGDIIVKHLNLKGEVDYLIKLQDAYPVNLAEIGLGYSMSNEAMITSVTFTYRNWKRL